MNQTPSFTSPFVEAAAPFGKQVSGMALPHAARFRPRTCRRGLIPALSAMIYSALIAQSGAAVTMSNSGASAPSAGDSGISQTNISGTPNGGLDYSDNGGALGQSFTLGTGTFNLNSISLNANADFGTSAYTVGTTWNIQVSSYDNDASGPFAGRTDTPLVGLSTQYTSNTFNKQTYTGIAAIGTNPSGGDWITFSFTAGDVLTLDGEHTYAFQVTSSSIVQQWAGFNIADSDVYAGGERFQAYGNTSFNDNWVNGQNATDRAFVVNLSAVPEPSVALLGGLGALCFLRRRRLDCEV